MRLFLLCPEIEANSFVLLTQNPNQIGAIGDFFDVILVEHHNHNPAGPGKL